jgi:hypothetical protein
MSKYAGPGTFDRTETYEYDGVLMTLTYGEATKLLSVLRHHTAAPEVHKQLIDGIISDLTIALNNASPGSVRGPFNEG